MKRNFCTLGEVTVNSGFLGFHKLELFTCPICMKWITHMCANAHCGVCSGTNIFAMGDYIEKMSDDEYQNYQTKGMIPLIKYLDNQNPVHMESGTIHIHEMFNSALGIENGC